MTDHEEMTRPSDFKDRKAGLIVFGILEVILGAFFALMVPLMIFAMIASATLNKSPAAPMGAGMIIGSVLFYVLVAVWFIWMGIGSIKARRWARALWLVSSWVWLIGGINGLIFMLLLMPDMYGQMGKSGQMPREMAVIMKYMMTGFLAVFYVIIPGALVLFYRSRNVKATCEFRDPHVRWTDKCPLPVLAVSLIFGLWAVSMAFMGLYGWAVPFFGSVLNGTTGALVVLVVMLLSTYVAWGTYQLNIRAWWCSILLVIAWTLSASITFSRVSIWEFYEKMNFPEQQMDIMRQYAMPRGPTMALFVGFWVIGFLGFLLYTKRYFRLPSEQESASREIGI
jgi:hypothetical protein